MAAACGAESGRVDLFEKDALGPRAHSCRMDGESALRAAAVRGCGGGAVGAGARARRARRLTQNFRPLSAVCTGLFGLIFYESHPVRGVHPPPKKTR